MDSLKAEEKYFVSCFIEECNEVLCPKIGKVISLYTYLDETNESRRQQEKQVQLDDPFIADRLRMISDHVDDEKCYKRETSLLRDAGYWSNKSFQENFRAISEWLWLLEWHSPKPIDTFHSEAFVCLIRARHYAFPGLCFLVSDAKN